MKAEIIRKYGHEIVDWVADYLEGLEKFPVLPPVQPGEILAKLSLSPPQVSEGMERILEDFRSLIVPGMTHWQHPSFFAYFPANNSEPSVLAEFLTAAIGAQCMVWQTSPAATELEERVMDWLRQMLGLPEGFAGVIQDTASTSTLCALLCARERATAFGVNRFGLSGGSPGPLTVYASEEAHSSVEKGVKIAGLGKENLVLIPTGPDFAMLPGELEKAISRDLDRGAHACCVVATVGTTSSTAMDPLRPIGEICKRLGAWFHVDGAMAGTAAILPEMRNILDGIEHADSFVFNPHKWMFTNFDCSAYFVRDPKTLTSTFEILPEYLKTGVDLQVKNFRDWGVPLGRRFRALKLWFVIRQFGVEGIREKLRGHLELARDFASWVKDDPRFELMAPVTINLVCFRYNPTEKGLSEMELEKANKELLNRINNSGRCFLSHTKLKGRFSLRMCIGQTNTTREHVKKAWQMITNWI
ncbi:MAG: aspartate aminotransferase family protein [Desulfobacteraceae bacterium]|jgi:aromatic-L-amino-acid decarboxylase|nr:MAG: aspartate aminotransferase family protein [Desulfobacteraceae bacterium]